MLRQQKDQCYVSELVQLAELLCVAEKRMAEEKVLLSVLQRLRKLSNLALTAQGHVLVREIGLELGYEQNCVVTWKNPKLGLVDLKLLAI